MELRRQVYTSDDDADGRKDGLPVRPAFTAAMILLGGIWTGAGIYLNALGLIGIAIFCVISVLGTLLLQFNGYLKAARLSWLTAGNLVPFLLSLYVHPSGHTGFIFIVMICAPFLVFSFGRERAQIAAWVSVSLLLWLSAGALTLQFPGLIGIASNVAQNYISPLSILTMLVMLIAEIASFAYAVNNSKSQLWTARKSAEEAVGAKSDFLIKVSHDIRTPMNGIVGMVDLLENSKLNSSQKRMIGTIRDSSTSLLRIIDDILDTSGIETGKLELRPVPTEMLPEMESIVTTLIPVADEAEVELSFFFSPDIPTWINCDITRIRQIIVNLVGSGIKSTTRLKLGQKGKVDLRLKYLESGWLVITVMANGVGLTEELVRRALNSANNSDNNSARLFGGTGLGLSIVQQLTTIMGGQVDVEAALGEGTNIQVRLPVPQIEGQEDRLSLPNMNAAIYAPMDERIDRLRAYFNAVGVNLKAARDEMEFEHLVKSLPEPAVFLIGFDEPARTEEVFKRLSQAHPEKAFITMGTVSYSAFGLKTAKHYAIRWSPLLPTTLWRAAAQMTGQHKKVKNTVATGASTHHHTPSAETKLLVVEDNPINQDVLKIQLETLGYDFEMASDGVEGLQKWGTRKFSMILTDCHMPNMDGFEMTRRLRRQEAAENMPRIPVMAITAYALDTAAESCKNAGMDDFLAKPLRMEELGAMLEKWESISKAS